MVRKQIKQRITERLKNTRLKQLLVDELGGLCELRPQGVSFEAFCRQVVHQFLAELHTQLTDMCPEGARPTPADADQQHPPSSEDTLDFDRVIDGLMVSFERDLLVSHMHMIKALGAAIAERDTGTNEHNCRVTLYAIRIAEAIDLEPEQIKTIIKGSFLHDVGKIGIPDRILLKPEGLTDEERRMIESHVRRGAHIIEGVSWLNDARPIVKYHHEKWDGTGYATGRRLTNIPLEARLFALADVFDALTAERPYKPALSFADSLHMMSQESGAHFDPDLLVTFSGIAEGLYDEVTRVSSEEAEHILSDQMKRYFGMDMAAGTPATV